jgi:hypothetical protein
MNEGDKFRLDCLTAALKNCTSDHFLGIRKALDSRVAYHGERLLTAIEVQDTSRIKGHKEEITQAFNMLDLLNSSWIDAKPKVGKGKAAPKAAPIKVRKPKMKVAAKRKKK